MNQETKVGIFLIAAVAAIMASAVLLGNLSLFRSSTPYYVEFDDVQALPPKAAVKISGVEIGKVMDVELINNRARVRVDIDPKIQLHADARARIGSTGIIGTRFVELFPGNAADILPEKSVIQGQTAASLEQMISKISSLFEEDEQYGNAVDNLKATVANIRNVSEALNRAMGNHGKEMEEIVMNIRDLSQSAKVFAAHLEEVSTTSKEDVKVAIAKFRGVGEKLDEILKGIQDGKGTIGALVSDEKTADDVKQAVSSIKDTAVSAKKVLGRFTTIHTYWNYRMRYDFRDEDSRSDVGIKFVPKPNKFYAIGVENVGDPVTNEKHLVYERKNRFTAVMGGSLGPLTAYAGAIRSDGGFGLTVKPFWRTRFQDRFELNAEASDFSRDRVVRGRRLDSTWVAAGAHIAATRWMWFGIRVEDVLERPAFMGYTNIVFRDEDLAYLLGLATVAR